MFGENDIRELGMDKNLWREIRMFGETYKYIWRDRLVCLERQIRMLGETDKKVWKSQLHPDVKAIDEYFG